MASRSMTFTQTFTQTIPEPIILHYIQPPFYRIKHVPGSGGRSHIAQHTIHLPYGAVYAHHEAGLISIIFQGRRLTPSGCRERPVAVQSATPPQPAARRHMARNHDQGRQTNGCPFPVVCCLLSCSVRCLLFVSCVRAENPKCGLFECVCVWSLK